MVSTWFSRLFFVVVAVVALGAVLSGTACTRWGQPGPVPPTLAPLSALYVNAHTGSDSSGNGSSPKPYKTLTKAIEVLGSAKNLSSNGVAINMSNGDYDAAIGEKFPIVVPTNVTITGASFGTGPGSGVFVNGAGQDTLFEQITHAPSHSEYTTLEVPPGVTLTMNDLYVGAAHLKLPTSGTAYASVDNLGTLTASTSGFGSELPTTLTSASGLLDAGGTVDCSSCLIHGNFFGLGAISVPTVSSGSSGSCGSGSGSGSGSGAGGDSSPSPSPSSSPTTCPSTAPTVTLTYSKGDATLSAKVADILTDGSTNVTASSQRFQQAQYAFEDSLHPIVLVPTRGAIDFGGGAGNSTGLNSLIGARISEISIVRGGTTVYARDNTWNPDQQGANRNGTYTHKKIFASGDIGRNVKIVKTALGSTVTVGPALIPTPSPSPSTSPSPSPT